MTDRTEILDRFLAVTALFERDLRREFEGTGLTMARTRLLWVLRRLGPSTQRALATALEVSPRNVTLLVDTLEGLELVARRPHPSDRRAVLVALTGRGRDVMSRMAAERQALAGELTAGLDDDDVDRLARDLAGIETRLREMIDAAEPRSDADAASPERTDFT